jgi:hypothetical protein
MIRKILYIIAVAWGLAFIWQTYAHADELPKLPKDFTGTWCETEQRWGNYLREKNYPKERKVIISRHNTALADDMLAVRGAPFRHCSA